MERLEFGTRYRLDFDVSYYHLTVFDKNHGCNLVDIQHFDLDNECISASYQSVVKGKIVNYHEIIPIQVRDKLEIGVIG